MALEEYVAGLTQAMTQEMLHDSWLPSIKSKGSALRPTKLP
jgi:hypothetical protein